MHRLKNLWIQSWRVARDEYEDTQDEIVHCSPFMRLGLYSLALYISITLLLGFYWSLMPAPLDVHGAIARELAIEKVPSTDSLPAGVATTSTLIAVSETLLEKHGGFLANDLAPPGVWLDDMPHWELGVLEQVRDTTQMLRVSLSQSTAVAQVEPDLQKAEVRFNFSSHSWVFPSSESQFDAGIDHLRIYNGLLLQNEKTNAHFFADAAHLGDYLAGVEQRLKNLSQRLTASIGPVVNTDGSARLATRQLGAGQANGLYTKTPWLELDDVFYEARGSSWALIALLQAMELDYQDVLQSKNAKASFDQIIRELIPTQQKVYSPMILNGEGFGFMANHSLVMASYLSRAQAAVADCRRQLLVPSY